MNNLFEIIAPVFAGVVTLITLLRAYQDFARTKAGIKKAELEIDRAQSEAQSKPEKSKPAWDLARATLEAYFNRNLSQVTSIYWLSVAVMLVGFIIVGVGISFAFSIPAAITPAAIASIAGIITEFIGATFLFIYRSTIQQAINYSRTLERINSVGMAMQILDTMPDETRPDDLKSKTKASLVDLLVRQAYISGTENSSAELKRNA